MLRLLDTAIQRAVVVTLYVGALCALGLVLLGAADVVGSQFFGVALPSAFEYQEVLMGMIVFGALASVQHRQAHIRVDALTSRLSGVALRVSEIFALACGSALFLLLAVQSFRLAARSVAIRELSPGFVAFPLYLVKAFVCVCCWIALAEFVRQLVRALLPGSGGEHGETLDGERRSRIEKAVGE